MAQLGFCSSSWSLLFYLHVVNLCLATPDLDGQAVWFEKPFKNKLWMLMLVQSSAVFPGQKQPQLWCFLLLPLPSFLITATVRAVQITPALHRLLCSGSWVLERVQHSPALCLPFPEWSAGRRWGGMWWPGGEMLAWAAGWAGRAGAAGRGFSVGCHFQGHGFAGSVTVGLAVPGCCSAAGKADFTPQWFLTRPGFWWMQCILSLCFLGLYKGFDLRCSSLQGLYLFFCRVFILALDSWCPSQLSIDTHAMIPLFS